MAPNGATVAKYSSKTTQYKPDLQKRYFSVQCWDQESVVYLTSCYEYAK